MADGRPDDARPEDSTGNGADPRLFYYPPDSSGRAVPPVPPTLSPPNLSPPNWSAANWSASGRESAPAWPVPGAAAQGGPAPTGSTGWPGAVGTPNAPRSQRRTALIVGGAIAAVVLLVIATLAVVLVAGSDKPTRVASTPDAPTLAADDGPNPGYNAPTEPPNMSRTQCRSSAGTDETPSVGDEVRAGPTHYSVDFIGDYEIRYGSRTPGAASGVGIQRSVGDYPWVSDLELGILGPWGREHPLDEAAGALAFCWAASTVFHERNSTGLENWVATDIKVDGVAAVRIDADVIVDQERFDIDFPGDHVIAIAINSSPRTYILACSPLIEDTKYRPVLETIIENLQVDNDI